jgi:GrpB-like predicted nucleotidyltransferase (UPF0157 family)
MRKATWNTRSSDGSGSEIGPEHLSFRPARTLGARIEKAFEDEQEKIQRLLPRAEVLHTGGTSVPDALTRGDLDIHVRVLADDFCAARDAFVSVYVTYHPEMWTGEFAAFVAPHALVATGVALTAVGGEHDRRFLVGWQRLKREPLLLEEYNALKLEYERTPDAHSYEAAKSAFFSVLADSDIARPDPLDS